jgi:hypothetical protein
MGGGWLPVTTARRCQPTEYLSTGQVAERLGIAKGTVFNLSNAGLIRGWFSTRIGRLYDPDEIESFAQVYSKCARHTNYAKR